MGLRLLLVDSDRSFLKEHQVSLEAAFDLEVAKSPEGVAARLEQGHFAAVLICVEVADNKGYALCSTLRKHPALSGLKIALISAKATEEEYRRHRSLKGRADLYLNKPIAPSALVAALSPLVPSRTVDPDNPLGDLGDTELGDDWLDVLKGPAVAPAAASAPPPPAPASPAPVVPAMGRLENPETRATAPTDTPRARLLEAQIDALRDELRSKDQRLREAEGELQRRIGSTTLNLDEAAAASREAQALKTRLAEAEAALATRDRELADHKEKSHVLQLNLAGLEVAMQGQERDLTELGARLRQAEAEFEASRIRIQEGEQQIQTLHEQLQERQEEVTRLTVQVGGLHQRLDESTVQHDGERLELMNGLDQKDAELARLAQSLAEQREAQAVLEREKQAAYGQLSEHRDRLRNLDTLLREVQEHLRRGSDLAKG
ncbi:response regulator [Geothrix campi]|uniref:response regulator n=1 Tax=Geothrix campi TaxID=2966450 RepID=UPI002148ACAB|nr:response regulator [Geothrix sp. SG10]